MEHDGQHNAHVVAWEINKYKTTTLPDPAIRKRYRKNIQVSCPLCNEIHMYIITVQGITGVRCFTSRCFDSDHHCKSCGGSIEPINYMPDPDETKLKRCESEIRKRKKNLIKNQVFVTMCSESIKQEGYP
jgi:hypothetical protein